MFRFADTGEEIMPCQKPAIGITAERHETDMARIAAIVSNRVVEIVEENEEDRNERTTQS